MATVAAVRSENATIIPFPRQAAALTKAFQVLAQANTVASVKTIRDQAEALRQLAKNAVAGLALQNQAAELKLRAERKAGQLLAQTMFSRGGRPSKHKQPPEVISLKSLGITKSQSSSWQLEARVPENVFERYVLETQQAKAELSSQGLLRIARALQQKRKQSHMTPINFKNDEVPITDGDTDALDNPRDIIKEMKNHHQLLMSILEPVLKRGQQIEVAQRQHAEMLMIELGQLLTRLNTHLP